MKKMWFQLVTGLVASMAFAGAATAQSVWSGAAGNWSSNDSPGWNSTGVPNAVGAVADINNAGGTITVDGEYTLGTIIYTNATARSVNSGGAATKLIFDVNSGNAVIQLGTNAAGTTHVWSSNMQLNDTVDMIKLPTAGNATILELTGVITGTGGFNVLGGEFAGQAQALRLTNPNNTFQGDITIGKRSFLHLGASGAAGSGTIDIATQAGFFASNTAAIAFITTSQTHGNAIVFTNSQSQHLQGRLSSMIVTLNGSITSIGTGDHNLRLGSQNTGITNVTFVLGGNNKATMGTARIMTENLVGSASHVQVNHVNALPTNGVLLRATAGAAKPSLLFNVAGTFIERIVADGTGSADVNYGAIVGTANSFTGTTVLNSASDLDFRYAQQGLELRAGHANATLEVKSKLVDGGLNRNLLISGPGTVILGNTANSYLGTTTVSEGTLLVDGQTGTGAVTVNAGATLGGTGIIVGNATVNGKLAPGTSPGRLIFEGDLTLNSGSTSAFEIHGLLVDQYDRVEFSGSGKQLTYGGTLELDVWSGAQVGDSFTLFSGFTTQIGGFSAIQFNDGYDGTFVGSTGVLTLTAIPEPGTLGILGFGLVATLLRRRMRKV
ncbi:MAG: PEP-CTERM sorting domain-containing protein [Kiritimatiellia bacterium]|nr:PEP-CTERM sorting domain-containing protein [Kiritimatiellia bacterium]